uniref:Uncharacterized protein n=1 Tax=Arundo donax TaxID=35708 RepID=A0A0A9A8Z4_ARUDO
MTLARSIFSPVFHNKYVVTQ